MDIFYTNETLYVNMNTRVTEKDFMTMKRRVFKIIEDYEIDNIVLKLGENKVKDNELLLNFESEYNKFHNGNLKII